MDMDYMIYALNNFTPYITGHVITYPRWDENLSMLVKGSLATISGTSLLVPYNWSGSLKIFNGMI